MTDRRVERRALLAAGLGLAAAPPALAAAVMPRVQVRTDKGDFTLALEAARAPLTCANFLRYVDAGKYDGGAFFRATHPPGAPGEGTLVGAAAPRAHPFPPIAHESTGRTGLRHVTGTVSLGRFAPGTATSDFFICLGPSPGYDEHPGAPGDALGFAAFGRVAQGLPVVRRIHGLPAKGHSPYPDQQGQWLTTPVAILGMKRAA